MDYGAESESEMEKKPLLSPRDSETRVNSESPQSASNRNLFIASAAILLGSLCLGITLGMSSPMIPRIKNDTTKYAIEFPEPDESWFGSLVTLGAMTGGLLGGFLIQFFGRKHTAMLCGIPFLGGMLMMSYARNVAVLLAGRTITGFAGGVVSLVVPTYISETSTSSLRGFLGSCNQLIITVGLLLSYAFGIVLPWRWLALAAGVPCAMLTLCCSFIPETPRYLLIRHRRHEARQSLEFLRGKDADVEAEIRELEENIGRSVGSASWLDVIRERSIRIPLLLSLGVMFFQQCSGINCVLFFSETIFRNAGFTTESMINLSLILLSGVQILFTFIACCIMDRVGRKLLLCLSGAVMTLSAGTFGLYYQLTSSGNNSTDSGLMFEKTLTSDSSNLNWLALASPLTYIAAFSIGLGPIPWLLLSEIIPVRARGKASGLSTAINWLLAFLVTKEFNDMQKALTPKGTYWMFSGICLVGVFYHWFFLPETKGKSLEEISAHFEGRDLTRRPDENGDAVA